MDIKDIYWISGFLEGEGSFYFKGHSVSVNAGQVQKEPLERLKSLLGGNIGFYNSKQINHQNYHSWAIHGSRAMGLMFTIYSLMSLKRKMQILKAINRWKQAPGCNQYKLATHCIRGHLFDSENTYIPPAGGRKCRVCNRDRQREGFISRQKRRSVKVVSQ